MLIVSGVAFWYCFVNIRVFGAILCCVFFMLVLSGVAFCFFLVLCCLWLWFYDDGVIFFLCWF